MELSFSLKHTFTETQSLSIDKVVALIGENGSGKSSILHSIFTEKLKESNYKKNKIVCFSSGQNEKFSEEFNAHLARSRSSENNLQLSCFYFDKTWARILIFLSTSIKRQGMVRKFLFDHRYISVSEGDDTSTSLKIAFKVDGQYIDQVQNALHKEAMGESNTIRQTAFHRTLESFIDGCIQKQFDFEHPIKKNIFNLTANSLFNVSFDTERDEEITKKSTFDPEIGFFIRACQNSYFLDRNTSSLTFLNSLELKDLSDGEYQILFLYALIDLFDDTDTIFILDEGDSHLHYKNLERFWDVIKNIKGKTISTTHLLDSIYCVGVESIRIVNKGRIFLPSGSTELVERLSELSNIERTKFNALKHYEKIVLIDDKSDWFIFTELVKRKLHPEAAYGDTERYQVVEDHFSKIAVEKIPSSWNTHNCSFAKSKLHWVEEFKRFASGNKIKTRAIFLVCDRDNLPLDGIGHNGSPLVVQGAYKAPNNSDDLSVSVLCWRRREIMHYLLSATALGDCVNVINTSNIPKASYLKKEFNGDYLLDNNHQISSVYNDSVAMLKSDFVKTVLSPFIENLEVTPKKLDEKLILDFISTIPPEEISEDITNMYNFIIGKL